MLAEADRGALIEELARAAVGRGLGDGVAVRRRSPACGDDVTVRVLLDGRTVAALTWDGHGCVVSTAAASALASVAPGQTVAGFRDLAERYLATLEAAAPVGDGLGDLEAFAGIGRYPLRAGCASLAWRAALEAVDSTGVS